MSRLLKSSLLALSVMTTAALLPLALSGCSEAKPAATGPAAAPATALAAAPAKGAKGGAELWAETCARCHNIRSPSAYSADQWQVIMHDMRLRAQLTGQEQRQILEFLKSAQ